MAQEAERYLLRQRWCHSIRRAFFGDGVGGVVAAFLFQIEPEIGSMDEWLWVVCGDAPTAYMVTDCISKPSQALGAYVSLMEDWVSSIRDGPDGEAFPVELEPTIENAELVEKRLTVLKSFFVSHFQSSE